MSPETIDISGVSFQSLQISWNHLTSAKVDSWDLEEIAQLFQHASQMTYCRILTPLDCDYDSTLPLVNHQRLQTLTLGYARYQRVASVLLGSLTLPCLQEFHANEIFPLGYLPALVDRSSCPLTRITFDLVRIPNSERGLFNDLQLLPRITDLVVDNLEELRHSATIKTLLLEEYFPDLRHLTLRPWTFESLWDEGIIPLLLDRQRLRLDTANEGRHLKNCVIDRPRTKALNCMGWDEQLKASQLKISLMEDGFEILVPET